MLCKQNYLLEMETKEAQSVHNSRIPSVLQARQSRKARRARSPSSLQETLKETVVAVQRDLGCLRYQRLHPRTRFPHLLSQSRHKRLQARHALTFSTSTQWLFWHAERVRKCLQTTWPPCPSCPPTTTRHSTTQAFAVPRFTTLAPQDLDHRYHMITCQN